MRIRTSRRFRCRDDVEEEEEDDDKRKEAMGGRIFEAISEDAEEGDSW